MNEPTADSRSSLPHAPAVLALSMFLMGACGLVYEYTLGVLGNNLIGSSYEQVFLIIGLMLFAMGLGTSLQSRITDRLVDRFLTLELCLGLFGGISALVIYAAFTVMTGYKIVLYGFAILIGMLIGLEIPVLIRINEKYAPSLRKNLSSILTMDYVGSLAGAVLFVYVLITWLSIPRIAVALGIVNCALAGFGLIYFWPMVTRKRSLVTAWALSMACLITCFVYGDAWTATLEQRCFRFPIIHSSTTPYQHLTLTQRGERLDFHINGKLQFSSQDEAIYHELLAHVPLQLAEKRERVLILGGGDGLALREVLRYPDVKHVMLVDIDPAVVQLSSKQPDLVALNHAAFHDARVHTLAPKGIGPGERIDVIATTKLEQELLDSREYKLAQVQVIHVDADQFLRAVTETYDVIIVDFPDPHTIELAKLYSVDFYAALSERLTNSGLIAIQSTSPYFAKQAFLCIGETLRAAGFSALPYHDNVPSFGEWGWHLAWQGLPPEAMRRRLNRLQAIDVSTRYLTPATLRAAFVFGRGWLKPATPIEVNTKMRPVLPRYYAASQWR